MDRHAASSRARITSSPVETCSACQDIVPKEWVPEAHFQGRPVGVAFTGWVSQLVNDVCQKCHDEIQAKRTEIIRKRQDEARQQQLTKKLTVVLGGDRPVQEFTFDRFKVSPDNETALQAAAEFNPDRENLLLWGTPGVGKTHLACAIARKMLWEGRSVEYLKPHTMVTKIRALHPDQQIRAMTDYAQIPVLIWDDLGKGFDRELATQFYHDILDRRDYMYRGGLVVTTNDSLDELGAKYGPSFVSRIIGMFGRNIIRMKGDDMRLKIREIEMDRPQRQFEVRAPERRAPDQTLFTEDPARG